MKVILIKDVAKIGKKGAVVEVPSGHAANFLIPRKLALPATPENMRRHAADVARKEEGDARAHESFAAVLAALKDRHIQYAVDANEQGHLFRGIHAADIVTHLAREGYVVAERAIALRQPIKQVGLHEISLEQGGMKGVCHLEVIRK
jgi:large subunit ribosomal protein L9